MKWFKHETIASTDPLISKLLLKYGYAGTGLYYRCLEEIGKGVDSRKLTFELEHDAETLAAWGNIDTLKCEEIMRYMVKIGLFQSAGTDGRIYCYSLATMIENALVKNPQFKKLQLQVKALLSGPNPDLSELARESSGNLGLDQIKPDQTKLDLFSSTATSANELPVASLAYEEWKPSAVAREYLEINMAISEGFIDEYLPVFLTYWIDRGKKLVSWDAKFMDQCAEEWERRGREWQARR